MPTRAPVLMSAITRDDVVILYVAASPVTPSSLYNSRVYSVMGETRSRISHFIDLLAEMQPQEGAEGLSSNTEDVCAYECFHNGQQFILVDTPGLNNGKQLQGAACRTIVTWLMDMYATQRQNTASGPIGLTGVIYTHSITNEGMSAADVQSFKLLRGLCGDEAADRVRLVTTVLDDVDKSEVVEVEGALRTHWQSLFDAGVSPERFNNTSAGAWEIIEGLENTKKVLLVQEELVDRRMGWEETTAGKHIRPDPGWFDWIKSWWGF
ncbi:hypothetical protein F5141DRAFT_243808 [Pisolithus sp. B1]|nr:hypothetical protein F5141DRAFT_243808 [Pisolithus sp. B1]